MKPQMIRFWSLTLILLLVLTACGVSPVTTGAPAAPGEGVVVAPAEVAAPKEETASGQLPRHETLYVAGWQWGPPTTFNPLNSGPTWPSNGGNTTFVYVYETLYTFNLLSGGLDPLLAQELKFIDETTAEMTLQADTHWQDGQPLTTADVLFTFGLAKNHDDLQYSNWWDYVSDMTATDSRTIQIKLNPEQINPGIVKDILVQTRIIPKHIWEAREMSGETMSQIVDMEPVGSGPYKLLSVSPERIALVRDDTYWGQAIFGTPAPKYIVHPIFKSNDEGNLAFQNGEVDLSQQFTPQIWQMWENKNLPVGTWLKEEPYYVPGSIPMLFVNVHHKGLDNPLVRRALAYSINYPQIAATAMSRYSITANSSLIIPEGTDKPFFNEAQIKSLGWEYNPDKAREILEQELGATKGADGIYVLPDGTRLGPYKAQTPYGWTDWMTAIDLVGQSANEVGIDVKSDFPEFTVLNTSVRNGDFDLVLWFVAGASPSSPWQRFRDILDNRGVLPFGETAFWNYGRFEHPDVPDLLDQAAATSDEAKKAELYGQLDKIFMENIPAIPLMYRPLEFYEYNETVWTGFPNAENPTASPQQSGSGVQLLYRIQAK
jgi:peptide/nickel transport system substrate-binding protein